MRKRIKCAMCGKVFASYEKFDEHSYQSHRLKSVKPNKHYTLVSKQLLELNA
ncbi:MAG: hypothetical protein QXL78_05735 [Methanocellales archaeon]